jgi:hypothetical protein
MSRVLVFFCVRSLPARLPAEVIQKEVQQPKRRERLTSTLSQSDSSPQPAAAKRAASRTSKKCAAQKIHITNKAKRLLENTISQSLRCWFVDELQANAHLTSM